MRALNRHTIFGLILLVFFTSIQAAEQHVAIDYDFSEGRLSDDIKLIMHAGQPEPTIAHDLLFLVSGGRGTNHKNTALFPPIETGIYERIHCDFSLQITPGKEGFGLALLNRDYFQGDSLDASNLNWYSPDFEGSFGIGFDISNPATSSWFGPDGNYYNRPQRELSLHWDGKEIVKILSPVEYRQNPEDDDQLKAISFDIQYIAGGAEIDMTIEGETVFDSYFIAGMHPYETRLAMGAETGEQTTTVIIDSLSLIYSNPMEQFPEPIHIDCVTEEIMHRDNREPEFDVDFGNRRTSIAKAILTLTLDAPAGGFDPWDKLGHIYIFDDNNERFELVRFITPYNRGYQWKVDVTDFLPLLKDKKTMQLYIDTWMDVEEDPQQQLGWKVSVDIDLYPGIPEKEPIAIINLWNGDFEYGNSDNPMSEQFDIKHPKRIDGADSFAIRLMVTGHGMYPNTNNAAEFMPSDRTLLINDVPFENRLWKTDCYLNSCRPQDGTWKFDRAGWAPGSVVKPWKIVASTEDNLQLQYIPMHYENEFEGEGYKPHHRVESQIIYYKIRNREDR